MHVVSKSDFATMASQSQQYIGWLIKENKLKTVLCRTLLYKLGYHIPITEIQMFGRKALTVMATDLLKSDLTINEYFLAPAEISRMLGVSAEAVRKKMRHVPPQDCSRLKRSGSVYYEWKQVCLTYPQLYDVRLMDLFEAIE